MYVLCCRTGNNPKENKGGIVRVAIQKALNLSTWGMKVTNTNGYNVHLSVMPSAQASIGYYDVIVETKSKDPSEKESLHRHKHKERICILFNAWCPGKFNWIKTENIAMLLLLAMLLTKGTWSIILKFHLQFQVRSFPGKELYPEDG